MKRLSLPLLAVAILLLFSANGQASIAGDLNDLTNPNSPNYQGFIFDHDLADRFGRFCQARQKVADMPYDKSKMETALGQG